MSVPSSVIHVLSGVPVNNSYEHTLYFADKNAQEAYFLGKRVKTFNNFTYLKPGNIIKIAGDVANARAWNYLMFQNDTGKWYYHFITKVVYLNDSAVELHIELDVIQTYRFEWVLGECFIERTHTRTDGIGEYTLDEGLETGPLVTCGKTDHMFDDVCVLVLTAVDDDNRSNYSKVYDGVFSGLAIYAVDLDDYEEFGNYLDALSEQGTIDAIVSMWMYPKSLVRVTGGWESTALKKQVTSSSTVDFFQVEDVITADIDGYTVKNNKLFCYPYTMLYVSNNMGGTAVFHRERFSTFGDGKYSFMIMGALSPESGASLVPAGYLGSSSAYEEALSMGAFPTCAWDSDTYKVWLAQNQNQHELMQKQAVIQAGVGAVTALASIPTGNMAGAMGGLYGAYNALTNIQGLMAQKADMEIQPPQARGAHSGNINLANDRCGFSFYTKTITSEYAAMIDDYFTRYGYKINRVDTPTLKNRERFTYIKTQGCLVTGNFGAEDQLKIQSIFDRGVTFWADLARVGVYGTNNLLTS